MSVGQRILEAYAEAAARGARHEAQMLRARHGLLAGGFEHEAFAGTRPLVLVPRRQDAVAGETVAFLASFTAERDCLLPLKRGLNRVGTAPMFGDYEKPGCRVIESRQWLVVCQGSQALVMDDHSTNQSTVLPRAHPRIEGAADPRFDDAPYLSNLCAIGGSPGTGPIRLDWAGSVVCALADGDVLLSPYAALVFGVAGVN
ncbi:MAG: hypothetical protein HY744_05340 [Deltaproteobacteria bacterium]|nr:hypothetical protein [Deltaproteobacteria bacterium]